MIEELVIEIVDNIFECPFYSQAQVERAAKLLDEKFKEGRRRFAKELLNCPLDQLLRRLEAESGE